MNITTILQIGSYFIKSARYQLLADIMLGRYPHWLVDFERGGMNGLVESYFTYENALFASIQSEIEDSWDEELISLLDKEIKSAYYQIADDKDFETIIKKLADNIKSENEQQ